MSKLKYKTIILFSIIKALMIFLDGLISEYFIDPYTVENSTLITNWLFLSAIFISIGFIESKKTSQRIYFSAFLSSLIGALLLLLNPQFLNTAGHGGSFIEATPIIFVFILITSWIGIFISNKLKK